MFWIFLLCVVLLYFIISLYKDTKYWQDRGVLHLKAWPVIGSMGANLLMKKAFPDLLIDMYRKYPDAKYVGFHQVNSPVLLLRDPALIKHVTVKGFDSFVNHKVILTEDNEPLFGKNLISLKGQKWKDMRSTLSPAFTSAKMRAMYVLITDCAEQFLDHFLKETKKENGMITIEMKDVFTRYTNDVIATAAFGIKCDSLEDKENEFYMIGKKSTNFGSFVMLKMVAYFIIPKIMKIAKISIMDSKFTEYFRKIILTTIKTREENKIVRPDMIHLLMEAKKGKLNHETVVEDAGFATVEESNIGKMQKENKLELTNEDIIAQAFLFFSAGYDTGSSLMGFMAYELAIQPEIQKKLQDEIDAVALNGKIDYETVLKMKYLDMVVSETLRKWPPGVLTDRICDKPYLIETPNANEERLLIEKDVSIWIPIYAMHHDANYFPDPERFDPERFSDENKDSIDPFTYLPFGAGPRNCIGSRFALLEVKVLFVYLLSKFEFTVVKKTQIPLKFDKNKFNMATEEGIWLGLQPRSNILENICTNRDLF